METGQPEWWQAVLTVCANQGAFPLGFALGACFGGWWAVKILEMATSDNVAAARDDRARVLNAFEQLEAAHIRHDNFHDRLFEAQAQRDECKKEKSRLARELAAACTKLERLERRKQGDKQ